MSNERIPNDPHRSGPGGDDLGRPQRLNNKLQPDPALQEGPASSSKVMLFAIALALVLGAVFYSLNNTSVNEAQTPPPAQTRNNAQAATPGTRDVTPKASVEPGTTTGSATNRPTPPQNAPQGTEVDRSANK